MENIINSKLSNVLKNKKIPIIIFLLISIISLVFSNSFKYLLLIVIYMQIQTIIENRKNNIITIFNIFLFLYYIILIPFYFLGMKISIFYWNMNDYTHEKVTFVYCIFYFAYYLMLILNNNKKNNEEKFINNFVNYDNKYIFLFNIFLIVVIIFIANRGELALLSGSYGSGNVKGSSLNEYILIPFLCAYLFSGNNKKKHITIFLLFILYSIMNFLYGGRIGVIQASLLIFYLFIDKKIDFKKMLVLMSGAVFALILIGGIRNGTLFSGSEIISNNPAEVYNASVSFYRVIHEKGLAWGSRLISLFLYLIRLFVSTDSLPEIANLSTYVYGLTNMSLGGGFIAMYFYTWLGYFGVVLGGIIVGKIMVSINRLKSQYINVAFIIILSTYPRWLVYDPITMIKLPMYTVIIMFVFSSVDSLYKRRSEIIKNMKRKIEIWRKNH